MDKIKTIKVREEDGSLSRESYYLGTDAEYIDTRDGRNVQEAIDLLNESKVSKTTDIVNNLASLETDKALSARQGYELKKEMDKKLYHFYIDTNTSWEDIQAYFDVIGPKIIEFKTGEYFFSNTLIINSNTKILLNNSIINCSGWKTFRNSKETDTFLGYNGNSNIEFHDGTIIGGAMLLSHGRNISFKNMTFSQCLANHIMQVMAIDGFTLENCTFQGMKVTTSTDKEMIQMDDCRYPNFPYFPEGSVTFDGTPHKNWTIKNCKFLDLENNDTYNFTIAIGNHTSLAGAYNTNINIENNVFIGFTQTAIRLRRIIQGNIINNYFEQNSISTNLNVIILQEKIEEMLIENNYCKDFNRLNFVKIDTTDYKNIFIKNNNNEKVKAYGDSILLNNILAKPIANYRIEGKLKQDGDPSVENPIEVNIAYGDLDVNLLGKNLYRPYQTTTSNGVTFTLNDDMTYNITGTATAQANSFYTIPLEKSGLKENTYYTLSIDKDIPTGTIIMLEGYDNNGWVRRLIEVNSTTKTTTKKIVLTGVTRMRYTLRVGQGVTINVSNLKIQLEQGISKTAFEPCIDNIYKISLGGGNLFNNETITENSRLDTEGNIVTSNDYSLSDYIPVEPYTTYSSNKVFTNLYTRIGYYNNSKTLLGLNDGGGLYAFTTPADTKFVRFSVDNEKLDDYTLIKGVKRPLKYNQYTSYSIQLGSIQDYTDEIYKENNDWYLKKYINHFTSNGDTSAVTYEFVADATNTIAINLKPNGANWYAFKNGNNKYVYCNKFKYINNTEDVEHLYITKGSELDTGIKGNIRLYLNHSRLTGYSSSLSNTEKLNLVINWARENPFEIYYVKLEPTITKITNTNLIGQLNNLQNWNSSIKKENNLITFAEGYNVNMDLELYTNTYEGKVTYDYDSNNNIQNVTDNILNGKKMAGLGDSLINGNAIGYTYTALYLIAQKNNMEYTNYGSNGNPIARPSNYTGTAPMSERYLNMKNDLDYIVVLGGANDKRLNVPIGTNSDNTNTTFKGALNILIKGLLTKYPGKKILFMTNYNRYPDLNSLNLTDIDYVDAMLEICALYGIPCFDNYRKSGISWYTNLQTSWADEGIYRGISANKHFSPEGYKFLASVYEGLLKNI